MTNLSLSKQLRSQLAAAKTGNLPFNLIVSGRTTSVSELLQEAITSTGGKIFGFDEATGKFFEVFFEGNRAK